MFGYEKTKMQNELGNVIGGAEGLYLLGKIHHRLVSISSLCWLILKKSKNRRSR
jgi:hypothetical protein